MTREPASDDGPTERRSVDRRGFLQTVCVGPILGRILPLDSTPFTPGPVDTSTMTRRTLQQSVTEVSHVLNMIEDGHLLEIPEGRYRWGGTAVITGSNWGISCDPNTVFEVPPGLGDGSSGLLLRTVVQNDVADNFLLENLTFECADRSAPGMRLGVENSAHVDGLRYDLNGPTSVQTQQNGVSAFVEDSDGTLLIEDYRQFNNGDIGGYASGESRVGIFVGQRNRGTVRLGNPVLGGFPNNACYVSRQPGRVLIEGGLLANNNVSAVRLSGGVEVRGTTIFVDTDAYTDGPGQIQGDQHNTRGVWGDNRGAGSDGGLVEDVSFVLNNYRNSSGMIDILENPQITAEECQLALNDDIIAINGTEGTIQLRETAVDGTSRGSFAGVGSISGTGNSVSPDIYEGAIPVDSDCCYEFDWTATHPETPTQRSPDDALAQTLSIRAEPVVRYTLTTSGRLRKRTPGDDRDTLTQNGDGSWTIEGVVDSGDLDAVTFDGRILDWQTDRPDDSYTLVFNGRLITGGLS